MERLLGLLQPGVININRRPLVTRLARKRHIDLGLALRLNPETINRVRARELVRRRRPLHVGPADHDIEALVRQHDGVVPPLTRQQPPPFWPADPAELESTD